MKKIKENRMPTTSAGIATWINRNVKDNKKKAKPDKPPRITALKSVREFLFQHGFIEIGGDNRFESEYGTIVSYVEGYYYYKSGGRVWVSSYWNVIGTHDHETKKNYKKMTPKELVNYVWDTYYKVGYR